VSPIVRASSRPPLKNERPLMNSSSSSYRNSFAGSGSNVTAVISPSDDRAIRRHVSGRWRMQGVARDQLAQQRRRDLRAEVAQRLTHGIWSRRRPGGVDIPRENSRGRTRSWSLSLISPVGIGGRQVR